MFCNDFKQYKLPVKLIWFSLKWTSKFFLHVLNVTLPEVLSQNSEERSHGKENSRTET